MKQALLIGLGKYGRKKTFNEILTEAGYTVDKVQRIELATELENLGLIKTVTYRLPFEIRAELTTSAKDLLKKSEGGNKLVNVLFMLFGPLSASPSVTF